MMSKIIIVTASFIGGYLVGWIIGAILGAVLGIGVTLFFAEILAAHQTVLMSILLSLVSGGLLGLFALQICNKLFETNDHPLVGIVAGAVVGVIVTVFFYGYINISDMSIPYPHVRGSKYFDVPPFAYSVSIGSRVGATIFPLFGAIVLIREEVKTYIEFRKIRERKDESKKALK